MLLTPISNPDEGKFNSNKEISFQAGKETHPFWARGRWWSCRVHSTHQLEHLTQWCGAGLRSEWWSWCNKLSIVCNFVKGVQGKWREIYLVLLTDCIVTWCIAGNCSWQQTLTMIKAEHGTFQGLHWNCGLNTILWLCNNFLRYFWNSLQPFL